MPDYEKAAYEAHIAKLLEALTMIRKGCNQRDPAAVIAKEALASPADDSALMERLKQERERIAIHFDNKPDPHFKAIAEAIRSMT